MKKYQFICIHDNLVTDDPDITHIEADSLDEAKNIALRQSAQPGRSLGNYELVYECHVREGRRTGGTGAMKYKPIRVIVKLPGEEAHSEITPNTLQAFQNAVGGYIETVTITGDLVVICDEDGRLKKLPYNCTVCGYHFVGPILVVGAKQSSFADAPIGAAEFTRLFIDKEGGERE